MQPSIKFDNVSKIYHLGTSSVSLRNSLENLKVRFFRKGNPEVQSLAALDGVSFEILKGESVGLIGPNGSGKTTALKLISNITRHNSGVIHVNGKISALIELGAGFHPDLTGRENIYFNAAILGMRRREIQKRFDEIVDFSGLERFLDTPVKRYSSGMYCRLGFAVAAYVNPDILLVDEVLAVGDQVFQNKCLKRMSELRSEGTTIIFVTHNLGYLQRLCRRAIFLYKGSVIHDGPVDTVIETYRDHTSFFSESEGCQSVKCEPDMGLSKSIMPLCSVRITEVYFSDNSHNRVNNVKTGQAFNVNIAYEVENSLDALSIEIWFYGMDGTEYASFSTNWNGISSLNLKKGGEASLHIEQLCLMPGVYFVNVAISDQDGLNKYDVHWERNRLKVLSGPISHGLVYQPHDWFIQGRK